MDTLEDHLRRATRSFTARLAEAEVLALGRALAEQLVVAHAESPARHPDLDPASIPMEAGQPRLPGGTAPGSVAFDLFSLGSLLYWLASGEKPEVSWRLDGPPPAPLATLTRRAALAGLTAPAESRLPTAAAAAEALASALLPEDESPSPWPFFRGDSARTGERTGGTPFTGLTPIWEAPIGSVVASPVLAGRFVLAAVTDGRLVFLEGGSGRLVHELRLASALESTPAVWRGRAYVGTDDGELVAVDLKDGRETLRARLGRLVRSSPLPAGERILVGVVETGGAGSLAAVDTTSGKVVWKRKLGPVFSSPALAGTRVLVGSDDGSLSAVDPDTGRSLWSQRLGGKVRATAAADPAFAVVGDFEGRLVAVRPEDGTRIWTRELGQPLYSSPCLGAELVVVGCHDGAVHGFARATGEPVFQVATRGPVVGSPATAAALFLVGSTDGDLYLLDASGAVLVRTPVASQGIQSSPALGEGTVFVGSGRGLHALRLQP